MKLVAVILYMVLMVAIGLWFRNRSSQSMAEYWTTGGQVGTFVNGLAMMSAYASAFTFMGVLGLAYQIGLTMLFVMNAGFMLSTLLVALFLAEPLRRYGRFTLTDYLGDRYDSDTIRLIAPILTVILFVPTIMAQLKGAGMIVAYLLDINFVPAVIIIGLVYISYVVVGGMWAITWTDVVQGILMVVGMAVVAVPALINYNGWTNLVTKATAVNKFIGSTPLGTWSIMGGFVLFMGLTMGAPIVVMRVYAAKNPSVARKSCFWFGASAAAIYLLMVPVILAALQVNPALKDLDYTYIIVMEKVLPPLAIGLAAAAILSALMSTTDAALLAVSAAVANDIYLRFINPRASAESVIKVAKWASAIVGLLTLLMALQPPALISTLVVLFAGGIGSSFAFPLTLGVLWKRATAAGAIASMVGGFLAFAYLSFGVKLPALTPILISLPLSGLLHVLVSLATRPVSNQVLERLDQSQPSAVAAAR